MTHHFRRLTLGLVALAGAALGCGESGGTGTPAAGAASGSGGAAGAGAAGGGGGAAAGAQGGNAAGNPSAGQASSSAGQGGGGVAGTAGSGPVSSEPLVIYWIDVEGGAATILEAPNGEIVVVDAGNPGQRDAGRVADVLLEELGVDHIDHMIVTHYHGDHVGGLPALAGLLPIARYYDHGPTVESSNDFDDYLELAGDQRTLVAAGDVLMLGELMLSFVTSAGKVVEPAPPGASANPTCPSNVTKDMNGGAENGQSVGFVARFGTFDFLDLGDLTWDIEQDLMCPMNRVGKVDLFQVNHHGQSSSNSPQLVHAVAPTVAVMNNGATKGGHAEVFETLRASPGIEDVWAVHQATNNDAEHNAEPDLIANLAGPDDAHYIKAVVEHNGTYTITNSRNAVSRSYTSH
jgi:beta-lactamase superfamily II metal-dependent hydrolase